MALKTVGNLRDDVSGILTGLNLNNVRNLYGAFERTARQFVLKAYVPEAAGKQAVTLYSQVYDYAIPSNMFGTSLIDLRPQGDSRNFTDVVYKKQIDIFDRSKGLLGNGYGVAFEYVKGVGRMRIDNTKAREAIVLDTMSDSTDWTLAGTGTTSYTDETNFYKTPASIRFNQTTGVATLTRTLDSQIDLTDYEGVGVVFLAIYMPTALTSIEIRIGSDSSNYFSVTETDGFLGAFTTNEWLLVAFDLSGATETGTVDIDSVDYAQVRTTSGSDINNLRVGRLFVALPSPHDAIYVSPAIFSASGTINSTITNDNDEIILQDNAYALYEYECALSVALQQGGTLASSLVQMLRNTLYGTGGNDLGLYGHYRAENPSEKLMTTNNWY